MNSEELKARCCPEPNTGCWLWLHRTDPDGYGFFMRNRSKVMAHRASYVLHVGPIGPGMCVCHWCDTPACVNPDHLWLGTHSQNMADRHRKGRSRGGRCGRSGTKWSPEERASRMASAAARKSLTSDPEPTT